MDISFISDKLVDLSTNTAMYIKDTAIWGGRLVRAHFTNTFIPAVTAVWNQSIKSFAYAMQYLQTNTFSTFTIAGALFIISLTAFKISQSHIYQENTFAKTALKTFGLITIVASTVITAFGIAVATSL